METVIQIIGAPLLMVFPVGLMISVVLSYRWRQRRRNRRSPLTKALLNTPGASLRRDLANIEVEIQSCMVIALVIGAYWGGYLAGRNGGTVGRFFWVLAIGTSAAVMLILIGKTLRMLHQIRSFRLGLDGEMATGEELNHLMRQGFHVYHDIPGRQYNVDHVVVGPNGVFAVETKTRAKRDGKNEARHDGNAIIYGHYADSSAISQAEANAKNVSRYLSGAMGRSIRVDPVVVLPGWFVKSTGKRTRCSVMSSGQIRSWFPKLRGQPLDQEEIQAVSHQLEQLCRTEQPLALSVGDDVKFKPKLAI